MSNYWMVMVAGLAVASPASGVEPEAAGKPAVTTNKQPLGGLFSYEDYPLDALKANQQGTTQVLLTIGTDGRVKRCEIAGSSGSQSLDAKTCAVLTERARFTPATDAQGRPVEGSITQRINWRLEESVDVVMPDWAEAMMTTWFRCVNEDVVSRTPDSMADDDMIRLALDRCVALERALERDLKAVPDINPRDTIATLRADFRYALSDMLEERRKAGQKTMESQ